MHAVRHAVSHARLWFSKNFYESFVKKNSNHESSEFARFQSSSACFKRGCQLLGIAWFGSTYLLIRLVAAECLRLIAGPKEHGEDYGGRRPHLYSRGDKQDRKRLAYSNGTCFLRIYTARDAPSRADYKGGVACSWTGIRLLANEITRSAPGRVSHGGSLDEGKARA